MKITIEIDGIEYEATAEAVETAAILSGPDTMAAIAEGDEKPCKRCADAGWKD